MSYAVYLPDEDVFIAEESLLGSYKLYKVDKVNKHCFVLGPLDFLSNVQTALRSLENKDWYVENGTVIHGSLYYTTKSWLERLRYRVQLVPVDKVKYFGLRIDLDWTGMINCMDFSGDQWTETQ